MSAPRTARAGAALALTLALALAGACREPTPPPEAPWQKAPWGRWQEVTVPRGTAGFTVMDSARTGVAFRNEVTEQSLLGNRVLGQGGGVALGDVDGDGRVDLFLAKTDGCNALYRNLGGWRFEERAQAAGVAACDRRSSGAMFIDLEGDADLDLVLLATTGPNAVFVNDGRGRFTERRDLGLDTAGQGGTTLAAADLDGRGRLSVYVANYKPYNIDDTVPPQRRAFNQMVRQLGKDRYEIVPDYRAEYKLVNRPDMGGLRMTQRARPDQLYAVDSTGAFRAVPFTGGRFLDAQGRPLREAPESFALGARFADLTGDGAPDLYVANDFEDPDRLWVNDGRGTFRQAPWTALRQMSNAAMGVTVGDVTGDGRADIFVTDMLARDPRRRLRQVPTHTAFPKRPGDDSLQLQQQRNTLFVNRGDGTFAEVAWQAGVSATGWSWGADMVDVDLDGWQDLLVANGHLWDIMDADVQEGLQNTQASIPWQRLRWQFPRYATPNVAFRNRGDGTFDDASAAWHLAGEPDVAHAVAHADLDGDGDLDVVVSRLGAPALLLRNDAAAPRVGVRLVGDAPNTQAVGARVRLEAPGLPVQQREVAAGGLYLSHADYALAFAMGAAPVARLVVEWRDGRRTVVDSVRPNRRYVITTAGAVRAPADGAPAPAPLLEEVTAQLGGHRHVENRFDDWDRQYLLTEALSQAGPGVAVADVDGDGAEDLVVGSGAGGAPALFRNVGGRLVASGAAARPVPQDLTALLAMPLGGAMQLVAGMASWELRDEAVRKAQPGALAWPVAGGRLAATPAPAVGSHAGSTGPLAAADLDGDGVLELFVGARAIPMAFPQPATSGLFRQVNGALVIDREASAPFRDIGLVSAATFADVNGDGHADLLLARDWGAPALFLGDGRGHLADASAAWGLDQWTGRWNGVAVADLDGDGRLDVVLSGWGRNTEWAVTPRTPVELAWGTFGVRGEVELLLAQQDSAGAWRPLTSYARARMAVGGLAQRFTTFAAYADASLDAVLGPAAATVSRQRIRTLDHLRLMNRGARFEGTPLPAEAQQAPAFGIATGDFTGDGHVDVVLAQNFSPTVVGVPRYDAGRGLLLAGDGTGALAPVDGARSGLVVYGDQRGAAAADFDGDGRLDLVVAQNAGATRLFRNRGAAPALRVRVRGPAGNPAGIGTQLRLRVGTRLGPVHEVLSANGYWSQPGAVQLLAASGAPTAVWVRWPGGAVQEVPVPAGAREVVVTRP